MSFHPETESYKYWTQEEDFKLKELVESGRFNFKDISKSMNRSTSSCQSHSSLLGYKNSFIKRIYSHNENFFNSPDLLNSYWAGMIAADGNVQWLGNCATIRIEICDIDHLEKFKSHVNFNGKIFITTREKRPNSMPTARLAINCRKWAKDLETNFNIIERKTKRLIPPNLNNDLLYFSFLLGYIDGDGTIHLANRQGKQELMIGITSCSQSILLYFKDLVTKYFQFYKLRQKHQSLHKVTNKNAYSISFAGMQALMFFDFFKDFPVPKLQRKWNNPKVLEFLAQKKLEYPNFFNLTPELQSIQSQLLAYKLPSNNNVL